MRDPRRQHGSRSHCRELTSRREEVRVQAGRHGCTSAVKTAGTRRLAAPAAACAARGPPRPRPSNPRSAAASASGSAPCLKPAASAARPHVVAGFRRPSIRRARPPRSQDHAIFQGARSQHQLVQGTARGAARPHPKGSPPAISAPLLSASDAGSASAARVANLCKSAATAFRGKAGPVQGASSPLETPGAPNSSAPNSLPSAETASLKGRRQAPSSKHCP